MYYISVIITNVKCLNGSKTNSLINNLTAFKCVEWFHLIEIFSHGFIFVL